MSTRGNAGAPDSTQSLALIEELRTRVATTILGVLGFSTLCCAAIGGLALALTQPFFTRRWVGLVLAAAGAVSALGLRRRGRPWAGLHVMSGTLALAAGYSILDGGIDTPGFLVCAPLTVALVFTHGKSVAALAATTFFSLLVLAEWGKQYGLVVPPPIAISVRVVAGGLSMGWAVALASAPERLLRQAIVETAGSETQARENARRVTVLSQAAFEALVLSEEGIVLDANDQLTALVGYARAEVLGMKVTDMIAPRWRSFVEANIRAQAEEPYEHELLHKDGTIIPVETRARKMPFQGRQVRVTAIRDMRDRKKAERGLKRSEEHLRLALKGARMGIWVMDVRTGAVDHLGVVGYYTPGERPPGSRAEFLDRVHPEDRPRVEKAIEDAVAGKRPYDHVFRMKRPDGSSRWVAAVGQVFRDEDGAPERMAGTVLDVTERVQGEERLRLSEERLRTLNAELERQVAERTADLSAANRELEAFAFSVSHDLRAPLRSINSFARFLAEDHAASLGTDGNECLERIRAASRRMDDLISALLDLSRIARTPLEPTRVDLSELALSIGAELSRSQPERRVELVVEPGLVAEGDASLLRIVLTNLLDNAWKYSSKTPSPRVEVAAVRSGSGAPVYLVRDNGAGFDPRNADHLFGAFQRLHSASDFPGTGVGLATVQRIVHRHGGRIWAEGATGKGATFFFTLPAPGSSSLETKHEATGRAAA